MAKSRRRRFGFCLLGVFLLIGGQSLLADSPTTAPATQPSTDAVDQFLTAHQYAAALKMVNKLAYLNNSTGAGVDPYQIDMLKGEAYIGTKATDAATDAFKAAANVTSDPHELAVAKSTILLLKNSNTTTYIPKTAPAGGAKPVPIPLADRDQRAAAFTAMLNDLLVAMQPRIDDASKSEAIPPIYPVLSDLKDLKDLDLVVNGSSEQTTKLSAGLVDHGHNLIVAALKGMWSRLDEITTNANQTTASSQVLQNVNPGAGMGNQPANPTIVTMQKQGLTDDNKTELKGMMDTCGKIHHAVDVFVSCSTSDKDKQWAAVNSDATRVSNRANDLLNFTFNGGSTYPNNYGDYPGYNGGYPNGGVALPTVPTYNPVQSTTPGMTVTPAPPGNGILIVNPGATTKPSPTTPRSR